MHNVDLSACSSFAITLFIGFAGHAALQRSGFGWEELGRAAMTCRATGVGSAASKPTRACDPEDEDLS